MTGALLGVYIFGSVARNEHDERSDLDLLAVVADGEGKVPVDRVLSCVPGNLQEMEASISWYGRKRLRTMFRNGELFAWHLHHEAIPLYEIDQVLANLGIPTIYNGARDDVVSFQNILEIIPTQLATSPDNAIYELGLIYVCLRNICMSASAMLCARPDFSRYSPFALHGLTPAPLTREEYEIAMACRMAGQRGITPSLDITPAKVADIYGRLAPWIVALRNRLESEHGRIEKTNEVRGASAGRA